MDAKFIQQGKEGERCRLSADHDDEVEAKENGRCLVFGSSDTVSKARDLVNFASEERK